MLVKTVFIFLLAMVLVGLVGKALFPGAMGRLGRARPATCPQCRRPQIGPGPCPCGKGDGSKHLGGKHHGGKVRK